MSDYIGETIKGVTVTKSGMIAAAHLGGARSVKLFLTSNGKLDKADVLGNYSQQLHEESSAFTT